MLEKARWPEENATLMNNAKGAEPATIGDEMCQRIINVDNHLLILHERLSLLADRLMGPMDQVNEKNPGEATTMLCPPLIERLSGGIHLLERRANQLEHTLDRFSGLA